MFEDESAGASGKGARQALSARGMLALLQTLRRNASELQLGGKSSRAELVDCLALSEISLLRILADEGVQVEELIGEP
jgi:hypothetical protein